MERYRDRKDAGQLLAGQLQAYRGRPDVVVLGLPRGGLPVAAEVARALDAPLDIVAVRKVGVPFQPEVAMGPLPQRREMSGRCGTKTSWTIRGRASMRMTCLSRLLHRSLPNWNAGNTSTALGVHRFC